MSSSMTPKQVIAKCINTYGSNTHPMAEEANVDTFVRDYAIECVMKALKKEKDGERRMLLHAALDYLTVSQTKTVIVNVYVGGTVRAHIIKQIPTDKVDDVVHAVLVQVEDFE